MEPYRNLARAVLKETLKESNDDILKIADDDIWCELLHMSPHTLRNAYKKYRDTEGT